jgi:hypothetical protein
MTAPEINPIFAGHVTSIAFNLSLSKNMDADLNTMVREMQELKRLHAERAKLVDLVNEVLREMDVFTGGGQPTGDAIDWANRARALLAELGETK